MMATVGLTACSSTTNTGAIGVNRNQLLMVSDQEVLQMSNQSYQQTLKQALSQGVLDTNTAQLKRVTQIANRLINQVGAYRPDAQRWNWEVHTIKSNQLNAYVLPGGKIMIYSGIIDRLNLTDAEIAAIIGHEMAHALREHARERMSRQVATQTGIGIAASVLGLSQGQAQLAGLAGDLGLSLPNSRTQETEADLIGLELMARAGYDPNSAVTLWRKMQSAEGQGEPPQFLSTHPVSATRIANLQAMMPKVLPLYQQSKYR
ncbi:MULTISPECIES: M48 family metallopeptidase [unclassified Moraxella]|uniref:M48 family metallopeptidase n=1 Tax=unclassified Moraxella TaxID=2685852 RepID=UPI003AF4A128